MLASVGSKAPQSPRKMVLGRNAAAYHLKAGGQRVRSKIALQAGIAAGLSPSDAIIIAATVELLHNASLVHDDVQDRDEFRRGYPSVWFKFGANVAICTGDLLLSAAYATLCTFSDAHVLAQMMLLVHERVGMAIEGQCADLEVSTATLVGGMTGVMRYEQIAVAKSGALLSLPLELVLLASGNKEYLGDAWHAAEAFAISYQILDDLHDIQNDLRIDAAQSAYNIVSVYTATGTLDESIEQAKLLGREKIDLAISLAQHLPQNIGERLGDYACQLRHVLDGFKLEATIGEHE